MSSDQEVVLMPFKSTVLGLIIVTLPMEVYDDENGK